MKMKKLFAGALAGGLMLAMAVPALAGSPTPPFPATPKATTGYSDAKIEFTSPTGADALYLMYAPVLDFGSRQIALGEMAYGATTTQYPLVVVDLRTNLAGSDFEVQVALSQFKNAGGTEGLKNANLVFKPLAASTFSVDTAVTSGHLDTGITGLYAASSNIPASPGATIVPNSLATGYGTPQKIFEAPAQSPINAWGANWAAATGTTEAPTAAGLTSSDVYIEVKGGSVPAAGVYTADMMWSLVGAP